MLNSHQPDYNDPGFNPEQSSHLDRWGKASLPERAHRGDSFSRIRISRLRKDYPVNKPEGDDLVVLAKNGFDRKAFENDARPLHLEGNPARPVFLFYGGLAGTGMPWQKIAHRLHDTWDNTKSVYSLAGHDGDLSGLSKVTHHDWVDDIIEKAEVAKEQTGEPVVFFGFSTSAVAVLEAARQRPELFGALVLAGPPLKLKNNKQALALEVFEKIERWVPGTRLLFEKLQVPIARGIKTENYPQDYLKSSRLDRVPLSSLLSLVRLQRQANLALPGIACPVLVLQGQEDAFVAEKTSQMLMLKLGSAEKEIVLFEEMPHPVMASFNTDKFLAVVNRWLDGIQKVGAATQQVSTPTTPWQRAIHWLGF